MDGASKEDSEAVSPPVLGRPVGADGGRTKERIVAATMRCVAEVGYARATIREIAKMAQMTSGSLYHYFPNKSELVKAAIYEISEVSVPRLAEAAGRHEGFSDKLMAVVDECDQIMCEYPFIAAFDRAIHVEGPPGLQGYGDSTFTALRLLLRDITEQACRERVLSADSDLESAATAIYTVFRGLVDHAATSPSDEYHATVVALKRLLRGTLFNFEEPS